MTLLDVVRFDVIDSILRCHSIPSKEQYVWNAFYAYGAIGWSVGVSWQDDATSG